MKSAIRNPTSAFTLIELLVVITIIVVLLAMLAPALDKAISEAERAVCAANLSAIVTGSTQYAVSQQRSFFICRGRDVTIAFNRQGAAHSASAADQQTDWPAALASVGLAESTKTPQPSGVVENSPMPIAACRYHGHRGSAGDARAGDG